MLVQAIEQRLEFRQPLLGINRVIWGNVEVILDRIRAARDAFEQIGIVRRLADVGIVGARGLLQHAGQPDMREPELLERGERGIVDLVEFADAVDREGAVRLPGLVHVAEQPDEKLIDSRTGAVVAEPAADLHHRCTLRVQIDFAIMRDVLVPFPGRDRRILRSEEPAPALVLRKVLRVDHDLELFA